MSVRSWLIRCLLVALAFTVIISVWEWHTTRVQQLQSTAVVSKVQPISEDGSPEICRAASTGDIGKIASLLGRGAAVETKDKAQRTPLILATAFDRVDTVRFLLSSGANPSARASDQATALHWAAANNCQPSLTLLVEAGAELDARDEAGQTPLIVAAIEGHVAAVRTLVRAGAAQTIKDEDERDALDWARLNRRKEVTDLLEASTPQQ